MEGGSEHDDGLLAADDVVPVLAGWLAGGARAALVTLVATDGPGPRSVGAQMAVREDGASAGYLSGGCLERSVVAEAIAALSDGRNRRVRFGGADGYFDLKLPCGAALDLYIDQRFDAAAAGGLVEAAAARRLAVRRTDLATGESTVAAHAPGEDPRVASRLEGAAFARVHRPPPRLLVLGSSPLVVALARLARVSGLVIDVVTSDDGLAANLATRGLPVRRLVGTTLPDGLAPDCWTATVLAFHEHDSEPELLAALLGQPGFYVGALGSRAVYARRLDALRGLGVEPSALARLAGPIGAIPGAKTQAALALGILTEVFAAARDHGFID